MKASGMQRIARSISPADSFNAQVRAQQNSRILQRPFGGLDSTIKSEPVTPFPKKEALKPANPTKR